MDEKEPIEVIVEKMLVPVLNDNIGNKLTVALANGILQHLVSNLKEMRERDERI